MSIIPFGKNCYNEMVSLTPYKADYEHNIPLSENCCNEMVSLAYKADY
jgi:hypothetical protein